MNRSICSQPVATGVPLRDLHLAWPDLWALLEPAVWRTPDKPDVLARLIAHDAQLWAVYEDNKAIAAVVTQITLLRRCEDSEGEALRSSVGAEKGCRLWLIGGSRVREWCPDFLCKLEPWARSMGCVALWGSGREGWDRLVKRMNGSRIGTIAGFPAWERRL
jgi:hypothetical protein